VKYKAKTISYDLRVRVFWSLAGITLASLCFYVYAVKTTVQNTLVRGQLESKAAALSANIGNRQFGLIAMQEKIDLNSAYAAGFTDAHDPLYISRTPSLSMNIVRHP
jgi:hypothetical protein